MKRISLYPLVFLAAFSAVLTGCNEGEDFGSAVIGGEIGDINQPAPLPDEDEPALEVELVVGKLTGGKFHSANVAHLKYECTGEVGTIPATGDKKFLARCATTASSVEFFIGGNNSLASERISLGTAYLPLCTGRSEGSDGVGCAGGSGFFQVTLADLVPYSAPAAGDPAALSAPARRLASDAEVRNRAALLAALDVSNNNLVLEVASAASNLAADAPLPNFKESSYSDFITHWSPWLSQVSNSQGGTPLTMPAVVGEVEQMTQAAMNRTRMGLYTLARTSSLYSLDPNENTLNLEITVPFIVMPDGSVAGVGALFTTVGTGVNTKPATDLLAIKSGAQLDDSLLIKDESNTLHWQLDGVLGQVDSENPSSRVYSALQFRGRIIGSSAYDNKAPQGAADRTDYRLDYPGVGLYVLKPDDDRARFSGFASKDNNALVDKPYRIARSGAVSAVQHSSVINKLEGFYKVTLYKACVGPEVNTDANCLEIPAEEIGAGRNYPVAFYADCPAGLVGCNTEIGQELEVEEEKPRAGNVGYDYVYADGSFHLQILEDGSIVTDRAQTCAPLDAGPDLERGGVKEYQVGYVSRTWPSDDGKTDSANVLIFMASSAAAAPDGVNGPLTGEFMPHYGTQIQGRINLSDATPEKPLFRLGDDNFTAGIRAYWQDLYQFGVYTNGKTNNDLKGDAGHQAQALAAGAAQGVALDASCQEIPPAP